MMRITPLFFCNLFAVRVLVLVLVVVAYSSEHVFSEVVQLGVEEGTLP